MNTAHNELHLVQFNVQIVVQLRFTSKELILCYNAQLRGEQRLHPNLKHCAINTKFEVEAKMPSVVNPS
ncbi:hypothetical protein DDN23_18680 [Vibrio cholerae]|nr:hypothetical protein [Vibrio cholerae]EGR3979044.1 hypothetical protein [Vibrio cholerae]